MKKKKISVILLFLLVIGISMLTLNTYASNVRKLTVDEIKEISDFLKNEDIYELIDNKFNSTSDLSLTTIIEEGNLTKELTDEERNDAWIAIKGEVPTATAYVPTKILFKDLKEYYKKITGEEILETDSRLQSFKYIEKYDAYYYLTGGITPKGSYNLTDEGIYTSDDLYLVEYAFQHKESLGILTLKKTENAYIFVSNKKVEDIDMTIKENESEETEKKEENIENKEDEKQEVNNTSKDNNIKDNTVADKIIPQTGKNNILILVAIIISISGFIAYYKIKRM